MLVLILFISIICNGLSTAKVTNKQYAAMPELFYQDNYDKCMLLEDEALYCFITYELEPLNPANESEIWKIIKEVSSNKYNYRHDHLRHSICIPFTCPDIDKSNGNNTILLQGITDCYNKKYENRGLKGTVTNLRCETNEPKYPVDWLDITVTIGFRCYIVLIILASFYEGVARYKTKEEYEKITSTLFGRVMAVFSIPRNWCRLKTVPDTSELNKLRALQGVRFYNTIIVVLSHTSLFISQGFVSNTKGMESLTEYFPTIFLSTGTLSVSTFFFLSSFFKVYGFFCQFENKKEIKLKFLLLVLIKRYLRLTPTLAAVVIVNSTWLRHSVDGPSFYFGAGKEFLRCRKNGWTNLLYINNIVDSGNMCMLHTWYLALDMQLSIIILFIIWLMIKYPRYIWSILGCLLCLNLAGTFILNYRGNYESHMMPLPESFYDLRMTYNNVQFQNQQISIIGNAAGSIIGLAFGYLFYKYRNTELFTSKFLLHQVVFHLLSYGLSLGIIILPGIHFIANRAPHDIFWASMYIAFSRPIYILGIGYLLFCTTQGLGWLTKYILGCRAAYILGRLSYCAYLIHYSELIFVSSVVRHPIYTSQLTLIYYLMANIFMAYTAALVLALTVEMPMAGLQNLILSTKAVSDEKSKTINKNEKTKLH